MEQTDLERDGIGTEPVLQTKRGGILAKDRLRSIVERIERLEEEKKALSADIKDIFAEAKGSGFQIKPLRAVLALRKLNRDEQQELDCVLDTYKVALGMV